MPVAPSSTAIAPGVTSSQPKNSISAKPTAKHRSTIPQRTEAWRRCCSSFCTSERISSSEPFAAISLAARAGVEQCLDRVGDTEKQRNRNQNTGIHRVLASLSRPVWPVVVIVDTGGRRPVAGGGCAQGCNRTSFGRIDHRMGQGSQWPSKPTAWVRASRRPSMPIASLSLPSWPARAAHSRRWSATISGSVGTLSIAWSDTPTTRASCARTRSCAFTATCISTGSRAP